MTKDTYNLNELAILVNALKEHKDTQMKAIPALNAGGLGNLNKHVLEVVKITESLLSTYTTMLEEKKSGIALEFKSNEEVKPKESK